MPRSRRSLDAFEKIQWTGEDEQQDLSQVEEGDKSFLSDRRKSERKKKPKLHENFVTFEGFVSGRARARSLPPPSPRVQSGHSNSNTTITFGTPNIQKKRKLEYEVISAMTPSKWSKVEDTKTKEVLNFRVLSKEEQEKKEKYLKSNAFLKNSQHLTSAASVENENLVSKAKSQKNNVNINESIEEKYLKSAYGSCEICNCTFKGKDRMDLKVKHLVSAHFQGTPEFSFINGRPPFRCPLDTCLFWSTNDIDCGIHYLTQHGLIQECTRKYLLKMNIRHDKYLFSSEEHQSKQMDREIQSKSRENSGGNKKPLINSSTPNTCGYSEPLQKHTKYAQAPLTIEMKINSNVKPDNSKKRKASKTKEKTNETQRENSCKNILERYTSNTQSSKSIENQNLMAPTTKIFNEKLKLEAIELTCNQLRKENELLKSQKEAIKVDSNKKIQEKVLQINNLTEQKKKVNKVTNNRIKELEKDNEHVRDMCKTVKQDTEKIKEELQTSLANVAVSKETISKLKRKEKELGSQLQLKEKSNLEMEKKLSGYVSKMAEQNLQLCNLEIEKSKIVEEAKQMSVYKHQCDKLFDTNKSRLKEISQKKAIIERLNKEKEKLSMEIKGMKSKNKNKNSKENDSGYMLNGKLAEIKRELKEKTNSLIEANREKDTISRENVANLKEIERLIKVNESEQKKFFRQKRKDFSLKVKLEKDLLAQFEEAKNEIVSFKEKLTSALQKNQQQKLMADESADQLIKLGSQMDEVKKTNIALRDELTEVNVAKASLNAEFQVLKSENELQKTKEAEEISKACLKFALLNDDNAKKEKEIYSLMLQEKIKDEKICSITEELADAEKRNKTLSDELTEVKVAKTSLDSEFQGLKSETELRKVKEAEEISRTKTQFSILNEENLRKEKEISFLLSQEKIKDENLCRVTEELSKAKQENEELETELERKVKWAKEHVSELDAKHNLILQKKSEEITQIKNINSSLVEENAKLQCEAQIAEEIIKTTISEKDEIVLSKNAQIKELQRKEKAASQYLREKDDELCKARIEVANIQALRKKHMETLQKKKDIIKSDPNSIGRSNDVSEEKVKEQNITIRRLTKMNQQYKFQIEKLMQRLGIDKLDPEMSSQDKPQEASPENTRFGSDDMFYYSPTDRESYEACGAAAATVIKGLAARSQFPKRDVLHTYEDQITSSEPSVEPNSVNCKMSSPSLGGNDTLNGHRVKETNHAIIQAETPELLDSETYSPETAQKKPTTEELTLKIDNVRSLIPHDCPDIMIPEVASTKRIHPDNSSELPFEENKLKPICPAPPTLTFEEKLRLFEQHPEKLIQAQPTKSLK